MCIIGIGNGIVRGFYGNMDVVMVVFYIIRG